MHFSEIKKNPLHASNHNLVSYDETYQHFNWQITEARLSNHDKKLNIAFEAVDRHVTEGFGEQVARARKESLRASEMSNSSCTVTSIGDRGAEQMFAVIYPPQVAIIALGAPHQEAVVIDNTVQIRSLINASLAADHRVSDGQVGARFLYQLNQLLQQPARLW